MPDSIYLLPVTETIGNAWSRVKGSKSTIWGALLLVFVITIALSALNGLVSVYAKSIAPIVSMLIEIFNTLLNLGLIYIGIKRAQDLPINYSLVFRAFEGWLWVKILLLYLVEVLIFIIPIVVMFVGIFLITITQSPVLYAAGILICILAVFSMIYIAVRISLASAFVIDKETGPVDAISLSFQATRSNFWRLVGIFLLMSLIIIVSAIPLGIGLIWAIPLGYINFGLVYRNLSANASMPTPSVSQTPQVPV